MAPPPVEVCRDLAVNDPETRKVNGDMMIQWDGQFYSVANIPGIKVKDEVKVCLNPWRTQDGVPEVVMIEEDEDGREIQYPLPHQAKDELGQFIDAAEIGTQFKAPADTVADRHRKEVTKLIAGESTLEAAEKKLKKNGTVPLEAFGIDPLKIEREAELPAFIERASTAHELAVERVEPPLPLIDTLIALREGLERPLTGDEHTFLTRRFENGATRAQISALILQFSGRGREEERKVG